MPITDADLAKSILNGNRKAFSELIERHKGKAMTLALRILRNREDAEEAVQDAFVRAFNGLKSFEWRSSFSTWFYRIVHNVCLTMESRRIKSQHLDLDEAESELDQIPQGDPLPDEIVERDEFHLSVEKAVENLPAHYAGVVTLFFVNDMSYEEIAQTMGMPVGTVKARLFRARALIRKYVLDAYGKKVEL
jgi:RNA polymerase sigma-70 factor (ECF subfamily)